MPVSPQDFALWSRMTGNPMPGSPAEQMMLAPQVFQFNRQLAQGRNPLQSAAESISSTIDTVGKAALGLGIATGAGLLAGRALRNLPDRGTEKKASDTAEDPLAYLKSSTTSSGSYVPSYRESTKELPAVVEEVREEAAPSSKEFLSSAITRYSTPKETPDVEVVRVEEIPSDEGTYREGQQVRSFIPEDLVAPAAESAPSEAPDPVRFVRERARGMDRIGSVARQAATQTGNAPVTVDISGAEPRTAGMADPRAMREVLGTSTRVAIPVTQAVIPTAETTAGYAREGYPQRLMLDDEFAVDNDIVAQNPLSNTGLASQDITSADPASAIGQRISTNQTGAAAEARRASVPQETIAGRLSTQQSPVHTEEAGLGLVGAPEAGAAEAFRKGRQYQAMKQDYPGLQDIASPTQEGVSSASILPSVMPPGPVRTTGTEEPAQPKVLVTPGARRTAEQDEQELLMRKYAAVKPRATVAPSGTEFLRTKVAEGLPQATQRGTVEHAVAEALEQREGMKTLPPGATAYDLPGSSVSRVVMYPNQQVGITYADDPSSEYGAKSTPEFYGELDAILKSGEFGRGGKHSAGGFIQAGKNLGLLY